MRILKEATTLLLLASTLAALPTQSYARLKDGHIGETAGLFPGEQQAGGNHTVESVDTDSVYYHLKQFFGDKLYSYLLEHDEFVKFQDIAINLMEKKYAVSRGNKD